MKRTGLSKTTSLHRLDFLCRNVFVEDGWDAFSETVKDVSSALRNIRLKTKLHIHRQRPAEKYIITRHHEVTSQSRSFSREIASISVESKTNLCASFFHEIRKCVLDRYPTSWILRVRTGFHLGLENHAGRIRGNESRRRSPGSQDSFLRGSQKLATCGHPRNVIGIRYWDFVVVAQLEKSSGATIMTAAKSAFYNASTATRIRKYMLLKEFMTYWLIWVRCTRRFSRQMYYSATMNSIEGLPWFVVVSDRDVIIDASTVEQTLRWVCMRSTAYRTVDVNPFIRNTSRTEREFTDHRNRPDPIEHPLDDRPVGDITLRRCESEIQENSAASVIVIPWCVCLIATQLKKNGQWLSVLGDFVPLSLPFLLMEIFIDCDRTKHWSDDFEFGKQEKRTISLTDSWSTAH